MPHIVHLGKIIELTNDEHDQITKCPNYIYKTKSGNLVKGSDTTDYPRTTCKGEFTEGCTFVSGQCGSGCKAGCHCEDSPMEGGDDYICIDNWGTHHVGQGDNCRKISAEECGADWAPCNSFADCPAICNSATVCPTLQVGDKVQFDCSLKGDSCNMHSTCPAPSQIA